MTTTSLTGRRSLLWLVALLLATILSQSDLQTFQAFASIIGAMPGPVQMRNRKNVRLYDSDGMVKPFPFEADVALDSLQRTFPGVETREVTLVQRWQDLVDVFGGSAAANELVTREPSVLRWPRLRARRCFHFYSLYLGPQVARELVFQTPYLLTKTPLKLKRSLPALINAFGSRQRVAELLAKIPALASAPVTNWYNAMPDLIAVTGSPLAAIEVSRKACEKMRASNVPMHIPKGFPPLVAILGGMEEASAAINAHPFMMRGYNDHFIGKYRMLKKLLGMEGANHAISQHPMHIMKEEVFRYRDKSKAFGITMETLTEYLGSEGAKAYIWDNPMALILGEQLRRALQFAEKKLGSKEAVKENLDSVMKRTGLQNWLKKWEALPRPRKGYWSPAKEARGELKTNLKNPWTVPWDKNGRWDDQERAEDDEDEPEDDYEAAVAPPGYRLPAPSR